MKFAYPHALWLLPCLLLGGHALLRWSRRLALRKLALFGPPERLPRILYSVDHQARLRKYWLVLRRDGCVHVLCNMGDGVKLAEVELVRLQALERTQWTGRRRTSF